MLSSVLTPSARMRRVMRARAITSGVGRQMISSSCGSYDIPSAMTRNVTTSRAAPSPTVTLDRPDRRNSSQTTMLTELAAAFAELRDDAAVRVVVLPARRRYSPPERTPGSEQHERRGAAPRVRRAQVAVPPVFERANTLLEGLQQITVAANQFHDVGGGWGLTLACDFRLDGCRGAALDPRGRSRRPARRRLHHPFVRLVGPGAPRINLLESRR